MFSSDNLEKKHLNSWQIAEEVLIQLEGNVVSYELIMIRRDWKDDGCIFIIMQKEILSKNIRSLGKITGKLEKKKTHRTKKQSDWGKKTQHPKKLALFFSPLKSKILDRQQRKIRKWPSGCMSGECHRSLQRCWMHRLWSDPAETLLCSDKSDYRRKLTYGYSQDIRINTMTISIMKLFWQDLGGLWASCLLTDHCRDTG